MADTLSPAGRSERMSRIRSKGNKNTELRFVRLLRENKIRGWKRHAKVFGRPDFVFHKLRLAIFIDGVFWHGHPTLGHIPKSNREFWEEKIIRNKQRDRVVTRTLRAKGWRVLRIWEHELKTPDSCWAKVQRHFTLDAEMNS